MHIILLGLIAITLRLSLKCVCVEIYKNIFKEDYTDERQRIT